MNPVVAALRFPNAPVAGAGVALFIKGEGAAGVSGLSPVGELGGESRTVDVDLAGALGSMSLGTDMELLVCEEPNGEGFAEPPPKADPDVFPLPKADPPVLPDAFEPNAEPPPPNGLVAPPPPNADAEPPSGLV